MHTAAELLTAFNRLFLDAAPVAALCALAVSWVRKYKRYKKEERRLLERLRERGARPEEKGNSSAN